MSPTARLSLLIVLGGCAPGNPNVAGPPASMADVVVAWNDRVLAVAETEDHFLTLKGVRTAAMMHAAMHDALNTLEARYRPYVDAAEIHGSQSPADPPDPVAVASEAGYAVAVSQYPDQDSILAAERARWSGDGADAARAIGVRAARAVLAGSMAIAQKGSRERSGLHYTGDQPFVLKGFMACGRRFCCVL